MERAKQISLAVCQAADPGDLLKGLLFYKRGDVLPGESPHYRPQLELSCLLLLRV